MRESIVTSRIASVLLLVACRTSVEGAGAPPRESEEPTPSPVHASADAAPVDAAEDAAQDSAADAKDGGGDAQDAGPDPVFGTSTFEYVAPGMQANGANSAHAGSVEGKNCIQAGCHLNGERPWAFAGTLFANASQTTPPRAEVRIVRYAGEEELGRAYTDDRGNFWLDSTVTIPPGAMVGIRTAEKSVTMPTTLTASSRGCSQSDCHDVARRLHVP
jgi:hypothetical protein